MKPILESQQLIPESLILCFKKTELLYVKIKEKGQHSVVIILLYTLYRENSGKITLPFFTFLRTGSIETFLFPTDFEITA